VEQELYLILSVECLDVALIIVVEYEALDQTEVQISEGEDSFILGEKSNLFDGQ
jgi:hypothetical protein